LPLYPATAKDEAVKPGVYGLRDTVGNTVVRTVDTGGIRDYDAILTPSLFSKENPTLHRQCAGAKRLFVVIDPAVYEIYGSEIKEYLRHYRTPFAVGKLPGLVNNEENKSTRIWKRLNGWLMDYGIGPTDMLIGIGGGVVGDLVGFAAGTTRRGEIPYLLVTTTLTATIDAGISPKTGINVGRHKNACGLVYPPTCVLSDTRLLKTDPSVKTGLAELIKLSIVRCPELFSLLEREGLRLLVDRFQSAVGRRLIDLGRRLFLKMKFEPPFPGNDPASMRSYGHSFSRQLESRSGFMLTHGEAIGVEMAVAASLACVEGFLARPQRDRIIALLVKLRLLPYCPECTADQIWPVFQRKVEADEPFWFPIPDGEIGRGTFLRRFSKAQLASAIGAIPMIRSRETVAGRVHYWARARNSDPPMCVTADFFEDGTDRFLEEEPGSVRSYPSQRISPEERTFAYRLLLSGAIGGPLVSYQR